MLLRGVTHHPHIFHFDFTCSSLSYTATVLLDLKNLNNCYAVGPCTFRTHNFCWKFPKPTIMPHAFLYGLQLSLLFLLFSLSISKSQKCVYFNIWVSVNKIQKKSEAKKDKRVSEQPKIVKEKLSLFIIVDIHCQPTR